MEYQFTIFLYITSIILMFFGLMIFFIPKFLIKISEPLNKEFGVKKRSKSVMGTDERVFQRRHIIGPILVLIGLILLYYSYYLL